MPRTPWPDATNERDAVSVNGRGERQSPGLQCDRVCCLGAESGARRGCRHRDEDGQSERSSNLLGGVEHRGCDAHVGGLHP